MLIDIRHVTRYRYEEPTHYSVQRLHLRPQDHEGQKVLRWDIVLPQGAHSLGYEDAFGNRVHLVTLAGPHQAIEIVAEGRVERRDTAGIVKRARSPAPDSLYLRQTPATEASPAIRALAQRLGTRPEVEAFHRLMGDIRDRMEYETGVTDAHTTAAEALAAGRGVCQDHAQVFVAAARHAGVPARYISGYLLVEGETLAEASHAWAEVLVPHLGWVGFDIANRICPTERYVRVASGLDARAVTPVRGTRRGGGAERLEVEVSVQEGAEQ